MELLSRKTRNSRKHRVIPHALRASSIAKINTQQVTNDVVKSDLTTQDWNDLAMKRVRCHSDDLLEASWLNTRSKTYHDPDLLRVCCQCLTASYVPGLHICPSCGHDYDEGSGWYNETDLRGKVGLERFIAQKRCDEPFLLARPQDGRLSVSREDKRFASGMKKTCGIASGYSSREDSNSTLSIGELWICDGCGTCNLDATAPDACPACGMNR
jgi:hypothetical protein